jgi:hypothetical protein
MLNKMSFYCQPILPLVYDESMSYYETLCKVVGQLNTTGDTVNKLNEGLTGEIADRQAADAALDARIKQIEETIRKIHFLKLDTIGNLLTPGVTRENLSNWIQDGDLIAMLYAPDELENSWAVATNYRCLGATGADSMQLSFYVPISVTNNAGKSGEDVSQEVVVISLPVGALTNQWTVRSITSTIPNTNADGFVNLTATVGNAGAVTCDVEPGAIVEALRNYFSGTNQYAVAVNARLTYDGKQYHSASAIVKADASGSGNIRIEFENYYNGVRAENGVGQMNTETIFLVGDVNTNVWSVETIDHKTFDFTRYEGFQFTRGENNVITANDESEPNAVYIQYHSDTSGKIYQNLPVRLIDTVDNAEYWNGVFDIKDNKHMTFTFVTSNYATASGKMLVRVIELSADANTTTWNYAEKEFELPISSSGEKYLVESTAISEGVYDAVRKKTDYYLTFNKTNNEIISALNSGKDIQFKVTLTEGNDSYTAYFSVGYTRVDVFSNVPVYMFVGSFGDLDHSVITVYGVTDSDETFRPYLTTTGGILPEPNPDDSDDGKVLAVNKHKWGLKTPEAGDATTYVDFWPTGSGEEYNGNYNGYQVGLATDQTFDAIFDSFKAGNKIVARLYESESKDGSPTSSVDASVTGTKEFGVIHFQFVTTNADTGAIAGFPIIGEAIMMMKMGEAAVSYLIENRNVLPTPNADGTDNGKVPIINGTKWELKALPTYANGNEVSY